MKVAFYRAKDNGITGTIIRTLTNSEFSHCALVFNLNLTFSSEPMYGTRFQVIPDLEDTDKWCLYDLPWIDNYAKDRILAFCHQEMNCGYDYKGVLLGRINPLYEDKERWFCSEFCATAIKPFTKGLTDFWYDPGSLYSALKSVEVFNI